jgi:hypothetical protein
LPQAFDIRVDWDYVVWSHVLTPLLVEKYESNPSSLPNVQDQRNGILPWLPLGWKENDLVVLDIRVKAF